MRSGSEADAWDPSKAATDGCKAYGAAAIIRVPGRLHISWENDTTLKIETDAGQQTRLLLFDASTLREPQGRPEPSRGTTSSASSQAQSKDDKSQKPIGERTWQGHSAADWERILQPGGLGVSIQQAPPRVGSLKVVKRSAGFRSI